MSDNIVQLNTELIHPVDVGRRDFCFVCFILKVSIFIFQSNSGGIFQMDTEALKRKRIIVAQNSVFRYNDCRQWRDCRSIRCRLLETQIINT